MKLDRSCPHYNLGKIERFVDSMLKRENITREEWEELQDSAHFISEELPVPHNY